MFESLTRRLRSAWLAWPENAQLASARHDARHSELRDRRTGRHRALIDKSTAPMRVPLVWVPAPDMRLPTASSVRPAR